MPTSESNTGFPSFRLRLGGAEGVTAIIARHYSSFLEDSSPEVNIAAQPPQVNGRYAAETAVPTPEHFHVPRRFQFDEVVSNVMAGTLVFAPGSLQKAVAQAEQRRVPPPMQNPAVAQGGGGDAGAGAEGEGPGAQAAQAAAQGDPVAQGAPAAQVPRALVGGGAGADAAQAGGAAAQAAGAAAQGGAVDGQAAAAGANGGGTRLRKLTPIIPILVAAMRKALRTDDDDLLANCCYYFVNLYPKMRITNVPHATEEGLPDDLITILHELDVQADYHQDNPFEE